MKFIAVLLALSMTCVMVESADDYGFLDTGYRLASRVYEECQHQNMGLSPCLKKRAITFVDRLARVNVIPLFENIELIKNGNSEAKPITDEELENIGRSGGSAEETLDNVMYDKLTSLVNGFNVQISMPRTSSSDLKRSVEEGRGKMKKMMGMMMMGLGMKMAAMVPLAIGVLFLLAGKAFIISKIALILSLIIALKKLLMQKQGGGGGGHDSHGGWQSSGGHGGGGWDRSMRSLSLDSIIGGPEAHKDEGFAHSLAYKGQNVIAQ